MYKTQSERDRDEKKLDRRHIIACWTGAFRFRYLLIPLATECYEYRYSDKVLEYYSVYVFGFRIIRLHRT